MWFDREAFDGILDNDEDVEEDDAEEDVEEEEDESDEETYRGKKAEKVKEKAGFEVVPAQAEKKKKRKTSPLTPEELALGQEMIHSKKRKRDLLDSGWNRYMFNEKDEDLPDWFVAEERVHMRPHLDLDRKTVENYRQRQKDLNVKSIKKVVEAKARKKKRMTKKLDKAKKKAASLLENPDLGAREKAKEINRLYKKAKADTKKDVKYVVAKKATTSGKRAKRPAGVKGLYKQVDPRMKKDTMKKRGNATSKRIQKRRLKGKKTRPQPKKK